MTETVEWLEDMETALAQAKTKNLPILLFFHNPGWIGCQQMDAGTYPDEKVIEFTGNNLVPLLIAFDAKPHAADFNIKWTPTLIILGMDGKEHHRTVGFLEPEAFIANQILGIGKYHFDNDRFPEALTHFEKIMAGFPNSDTIPEAIFLQGVARYKKLGDPKPLKDAYEKLTTDFPDNEWTKRAYPYRLL